jgi:hypothetical protein
MPLLLIKLLLLSYYLIALLYNYRVYLYNFLLLYLARFFVTVLLLYLTRLYPMRLLLSLHSLY